MSKIPSNLKAREGEHFLVTVPNHWGRAPTLAEAVANCRRASGKPIGEYWRVRSVHPEAYLDDMGYLRTPKGAAEPLTLAENDPGD